MLWEIRDPQGRPSGGLGSVRVQADGSIVVCWGGLQPMFQEFGPDHVSRMTIASDAAAPVVPHREVPEGDVQRDRAAGGRRWQRPSATTVTVGRPQFARPQCGSPSNVWRTPCNDSSPAMRVNWSAAASTVEPCGTTLS